MVKRVDQQRVHVDGNRVSIGKGAAAKKAEGGDKAGEAKSAAAVEKLQDNPNLDKLVRAVERAGVGLTVDFGASPIGPDAAAQLFSQLLGVDATDVVGLTQYLSALGVQVGYQGTPLSHFTGITHRLADIKFPDSPPAALMPAYMKIQELSAKTKQMAIGLQRDQSPANLRTSKTQAVFIAHDLAEIWRRAPDFDKSGDLQRTALTALKNVADLQGRIQFAMQDFVENTKRGMGLPTEGAQPLLDPKDGALIFRNSLRLGRVELDPNVRQQELDTKFQKALKKGVKTSDIEEMGSAFLKKTPHGARFEYVLVPKKGDGENDKLRVTLNEAAGHSMLAGVDPNAPDKTAGGHLEDNYGRVAGGARYLRANNGTEIVLADPKSGHYRAPTQQAEQLVPFLVAAGVPKENIIITSGDPLDTGEVLAIDVWVYKQANDNQLPKEVGDKFFADSVKLYEEAVAHGQATADAVLKGA